MWCISVLIQPFALSLISELHHCISAVQDHLGTPVFDLLDLPNTVQEWNMKFLFCFFTVGLWYKPVLCSNRALRFPFNSASIWRFFSITAFFFWGNIIGSIVVFLFLSECFIFMAIARFSCMAIHIWDLPRVNNCLETFWRLFLYF